MKLLLTILIVLTTTVRVMSQCEDLIKRESLPFEFRALTKLTPDPCNALDNYNTNKVLIYSPVQGYREKRYRVKMIQEISWDADDCKPAIIQVSRDTTLKEEIYIGTKPGQTTGGYYTVRMELMRNPPESRPQNTMATMIPYGQSMGGYWVVHAGRFETIEEARIAVNYLKEVYPEFCRAFAYFLPENCEFQYRYEIN